MEVTLSKHELIRKLIPHACEVLSCDQPSTKPQKSLCIKHSDQWSAIFIKHQNDDFGITFKLYKDFIHDNGL